MYDQMDYLHSCVPRMVQEEQFEDLSHMFQLFKGIPRALNPVVDEFRERVRQQGELKLVLSPLSQVLCIHYMWVYLSECFIHQASVCSYLHVCRDGYVGRCMVL